MTVADRPECLRWNGRVRDICNGAAVDVRRTNKWRQKFGLSPLAEEQVVPRPPKLMNRPRSQGDEWDVSQPSRGLGDVVAKLAAKVGIHKRRGCGCQRRQSKLNTLIPFGRKGQK